MPKSKKPKISDPLQKVSTSAVLSMLQELPDCVVAFDKKDQIVFANDCAQSFFGMSDKRMQNSKITDLFFGDSPVIHIVRRVMQTHHPLTIHDLHINQHKVDSVTATSLDNQNLFMIVIRHSLLDLKAEWTDHAKGALEPAQNLARVWAHEIKNPLAGIRGAAQLLAKTSLSDEDRELALLIERESDRIFRMVDKLKIFGENVAQSRQKVNLHEVLNHVTKVAKSSFADNVDIEEDYDPSMPDIEGDFDHLVQAQMNLVKNAAEAMHGKETRGKISIRTFYDKAAAYHPSTREKLPLCIEIEDNGTGLTPEMVHKIFQPYYTTKQQGEGLGLPIVSKIVDDHGGTIGVRSSHGKTVFRVSLPMPEKGQNTPPPPSAKPTSKKGSKK